LSIVDCQLLIVNCRGAIDRAPFRDIEKSPLRSKKTSEPHD
jgi:hypothetical protein